MAPPSIIGDVHLPDGSGPYQLRLQDGLITAITRMTGEDVPPGPATVDEIAIDGRGGVALPGLIDAHCHMDQSLMLADWTPIPPSDAFIDKIRAAERVLLGMTSPSLVERVDALAWSMVANGTLVARSHASVTPGVGLAGVEALLEVKRRLTGILDLQVVAFPQFGTLGPDMARLMDEAMRRGCDIVGGMDPATIDRDVEMSLRWTFGLAERYAAPVDIHIHDPGHLGLYELGRLCDWTARSGMGGRVVASHALCLGELPEDEVASTLDRLAMSGVAVVSAANPNAAMPRVEELVARGVDLGLGSDTAHTSAPFGTSDMFKKANLLAQRHTLVTDAALFDTLERVTTVNAGILGVAGGRIEVGAPADLLVVGARSGAEAIASPPRWRTVIVAGAVVAETRP